MSEGSDEGHLLLERYLRNLSIELGRSKNTIESYRRDLTSYLEYLNTERSIGVSAVTENDIRSYLQALRSGPVPLAASSTARAISSIRGFHKFLLDEGASKTDPASDLKPPKQPSLLPKAISISQMATVLETTQGDDWVSLRDKALLELMYATGARVSEAAALNVDDIFDGTGSGIADVVRLFGKGGKQRLVPLGRFAREALDSYLVRVRPALAVKGKAGPALFLGERGSRLSRQSIWLIIQARFAQSNIGVHASPHTFRHSFATHMLEGGADIKVVQELLGHSSISTTQIYTLVTADTLREVYLTSHPRSHRRQVDSQSD